MTTSDDCEKCKELEKELKEAERLLDDIYAACDAVNALSVETLSTGNHPRGYWSRLRGRIDMAADILRKFGEKPREIQRRPKGIFGAMFRGLRL